MLLNPEHLLDQADRLVALVGARRRQADLRRAMSAIYYAIFHAVLTDFTELVGQNQRASAHYAMVYRSVMHTELSSLCEEVVKQTPKVKFKPYIPAGGFHIDLVSAATAIIALKQKRHSADYDPLFWVTPSDAIQTVKMGRAALGHWRVVPAAHRQVFNLLLGFR